MTQVKFINRPIERTFPNLMEEFFKFPHLEMKSSVPVNIYERNDAYKLDVIAPGFEKSDFNVSIDNNLLTISLEKENEQAEENVKQLRSEYSYRNFKRSFTLDEKVDAEKIEASYTNGVLSLNLPFKMEVKNPVKQITIQ